MKVPVETAGAPAAVGPYSQAVAFGDFVFASGQLPIDPATGSIAAGAAAQTRQCLDNVQQVLSAAGTSMSNVVKTTLFLADLADFQIVNEIYADYFSKPYPARSTVEVKRLYKDVLVEIEVVAALPAAT